MSILRLADETSASIARGERVFQGVVFDCDGVVVDSEPLAERALGEVLASYDRALPPEELDMLRGRTAEQVYSFVVTAVGRSAVPPKDEFDDRFRRRIHALWRSCLRGFPDTLRLVRELTDARMPYAIATNSTRDNLDTKLAVVGLTGLFPVSVTSDDVPEPKPAPDIFLAAADRLGLDPSACVAVEDTDVGSAAARAAGMYVVLVERGLYAGPRSARPACRYGCADVVVRGVDTAVVADLLGMERRVP